MANFAIAKPLIDGAIHMRDCEIRPTGTCKQCLEAITRWAGAMSETIEVAGILRQWTAELSAAMPRAEPPVPSPGSHTH